MNVALPAFVVFIVLLPGFIARSRIKRIERLTLDYSPFGQVATEAIVWAGALHALWNWLTEVIFARVFHSNIALSLLSSSADAQTNALKALAVHTSWVTTYFGTLIAFAYLGPMAIRLLITHCRLDRYDAQFSTMFRFSQAPWYYLLSGSDFAKDEIPDFIAVSAIVDVAGKPFLYTGVLDDYFIDQDGQLDRLILEEVQRRPIDSDKLPDDSGVLANRFYPIDGDYFVLRYSEAVTLNIEYIKLAKSLESES
jgi:hypothetical protein